MAVIGIIPARYASTRFPGKPLADLCGKPMIQRVWEAARSASLLERVFIATDDERIYEVCKEFGAEVVMTSRACHSGSERVLEAFRQIAAGMPSEPEIIINIQGDEPLLHGTTLDALVHVLQNELMQRKQYMALSSAPSSPSSSVLYSSSAPLMATFVQPISAKEELFNPDIVKVALSRHNRALYFSRSVIPFASPHTQHSYHNASRNATAEEITSEQAANEKAHLEETLGRYWKHIGLYAFTLPALEAIADTAPSPLELQESLEQLRFLEEGCECLCIEAEQMLVSVNTPDDAERVRSILTQ